MIQSVKYPTIKEATYTIHAHGNMLTSIFHRSKKFLAINIPENVEIYTFDNLGKCIPANSGEADFICNIYQDKYKTTLRTSIVPAFKFTNEHGKINKFPEIFLTPDNDLPASFYSGIIHCIPEIFRTSDLREKEIIYNIDPKNTKNCECSSIVLIKDSTSYDCNKKYSDDYKNQLTDYKYEPNVQNANINKCGPLLLSEALKIIQTHCKKNYESNCMIKIYVFACLVETDLQTLINTYSYQYELVKRSLNPQPNSPSICSTIKDSPKFCVPVRSSSQKQDSVALIAFDERSHKKEQVKIHEQHTSLLEELKKKDITHKEQENINLMEYYYEIMKHNTIEKVDFENVVESLSLFNANPLIKSHLSRYIFMVNSKKFEFITYKDAYIDFTTNLTSQFTGSYEEVNEQIEKKYRARSIHKLENYLTNAIFKINNDDSTNDIDILPKFNTINLVSPFVTKASDDDLTYAVYYQLKGLIKYEQAKLGHGRRKKTLRKKYKKPKKTKYIRKFTHNLKSKKHTKKAV
jgi:hypothetical protein